MKYRLALLALLLLASTSALAQGCQPMAQAQLESEGWSKKLHGEVLNLSGKEASDYLAIVNAEPPETKLSAPAIMLLAVPEKGTVIGLVFGTTVCVAGRIPASLHDKALKAARGEES